MLLFRSEEHIERWRRTWSMPRGATLAPRVAWELAYEWYHDRADPKWRRRTIDEAHALFAQLGLNGDFWKLN